MLKNLFSKIEFKTILFQARFRFLTNIVSLVVYMVTAAVLLATAQQDIEYIPVLSCSMNSTLSRKCLVKKLFTNHRKDFSVKKLWKEY